MNVDLGESFIILADDLLWYFDYIGKYVILNLNHERVFNQSTLFLVLKLFNRYYKKDIKIYESSSESWLLDMVLFQIEDPDITQDESLKEFLKKELSLPRSLCWLPS